MNVLKTILNLQQDYLSQSKGIDVRWGGTDVKVHILAVAMAFEVSLGQQIQVQASATNTVDLG